MLVAAMASGCSTLTSRHRAIAAAADVTAAVGTLVAVISLQREDKPVELDPRRHHCDAADRRATYGGVAVLLAASVGLFLMLDESSRPADERVGAPVVTVTEGPALPPLPEVETDPQTLQFAKQARRASVGGDCATARNNLERIAERDPAYHAALVGSPAVAACRSRYGAASTSGTPASSGGGGSTLQSCGQVLSSPGAQTPSPQTSGQSLPQIDSASPTQVSSQSFSQQYESTAQTWPTHGSQPGSRSSPAVQVSCGQTQPPGQSAAQVAHSPGLQVESPHTHAPQSSAHRPQFSSGSQVPSPQLLPLPVSTHGTATMQSKICSQPSVLQPSRVPSSSSVQSARSALHSPSQSPPGPCSKQVMMVAQSRPHRLVGPASGSGSGMASGGSDAASISVPSGVAEASVPAPPSSPQAVVTRRRERRRRGSARMSRPPSKVWTTPRSRKRGARAARSQRILP